jgi:hypothetical protein
MSEIRKVYFWLFFKFDKKFEDIKVIIRSRNSKKKKTMQWKKDKMTQKIILNKLLLLFMFLFIRTCPQYQTVKLYEPLTDVNPTCLEVFFTMGSFKDVLRERGPKRGVISEHKYSDIMFIIIVGTHRLITLRWIVSEVDHPRVINDGSPPITNFWQSQTSWNQINQNLESLKPFSRKRHETSNEYPVRCIQLFESF